MFYENQFKKKLILNFANKDLHTVDLEDYKYGGCNITGLRMVDPTKAETANIIGDWVYGERRYGSTLNLDAKTLKVTLKKK